MSINQKIKNLIKTYSIAVGCFFVYFFIIAILTLAFPELNLDQLKESKLQDIMKDNPLKFFVLAVILAPFFEEALYRTLVKPKSWEISLLLASLIIVFAARLIPEDVVWWLKSMVTLLTLFILFKCIDELFPKYYKRTISDFLSQHTTIIVIISSILFGFAHVSNYTETFVLTWPIFIAIVPRIILGFSFCKIKIENDHLGWAMGLHALNNGIVFLITYATMYHFEIDKSVSLILK